MPFDSSTLCARTSAGEAELATPSQGLSLGQRRVLTLLQSPAAVEELAEKHHLEPEKLAKDLSRLAELRLVELQGPPFEMPHSTPPAAFAAMTPVVIGSGRRRTLPLVTGGVVLVLAVGIWYGIRSKNAATTPHTPAVQAVSAPAIDPSAPPAPTAASASLDADPAVATVLRGKSALADLPADIRPGLAPAASVPPKPIIASPAPEPKSAAITAPAVAATSSPGAPAVAQPSVAPPAVAPPPPAASMPTAAPASSSAPTATGAANAATAAAPGPAADSAPALLLASAAPAPAAPRPTLASELKAISREAPDFPKEAVAEGLRSGVVNARLHIDARGNVAAVDILASQPPRIFDKAARKALFRWQFAPLADGHTAELDVDVKFQRD
jgi:periplasmic protein TonB